MNGEAALGTLHEARDGNQVSECADGAERLRHLVGDHTTANDRFHEFAIVRAHAVELQPVAETLPVHEAYAREPLLA